MWNVLYGIFCVMFALFMIDLFIRFVGGWNIVSERWRKIKAPRNVEQPIADLWNVIMTMSNKNQYYVCREVERQEAQIIYDRLKEAVQQERQLYTFTAPDQTICFRVDDISIIEFVKTENAGH